MKKILILLPRQLGDVLLGTPLAQVLKTHMPESLVDWWANPLAKPILEGNPFLDHIFYHPVWDKKKKVSGFSKITRFFQWLRFIYASIVFVFKIRAQRYDIVIDAMNYPRSSLQTWFTGAPIRISFTKNSFRDKIYTHLIRSQAIDSGYLAHTRLKLLSPLNIVLSDNELKELKAYLPISEADKQKPHVWLENVSLKSKQFCVVSPAPRSPSIANRCWPAEYYVNLAFEIIRKHNCAVVWLCTPSELYWVSPMHAKLNALLKTHNLHTDLNLIAPSFSLREVGFLSTLACGWIGNCNGMSHVAVACGVKTITLYGPTKLRNWAHPNQTKHRSVQRAHGCIECTSNVCKLPRRECLDDLSVETVLNEVENLFFKNRSFA